MRTSASSQPVLLDTLAAIPEEEIWRAKQKNPRTRRAYRLDVRHFMRALGISEIDQLRAVDHRAVIAREQMQREQEGAAASAVAAAWPRYPACSSIW